MLRQCKFNPDSCREILVLLARLRAGTATTKDLVESCFNHLMDIAQRHSKNSKMSMRAKWLYATTSSYGQSSAPQIRPTPQDWLNFSMQDKELMKVFGRAGACKATCVA